MNHKKLAGVVGLAVIFGALFFQNCSKVDFVASQSSEKLVYPACRELEAPEVAPKLKWDWLAQLKNTPVSERYQTFNQVMASPMVADLNGDGLPEVVFTSFSVTAGDIYPDSPGRSYSGNGVLRVVSGATGDTLFSITGQELAPFASQSPLLIDIDGDGKVEIVYVHYSGKSIIALNFDGSLRWKFVTPVPSVGTFYSGLTASDVDHDGVAEIMAGPYLISEDSSRVPYVKINFPQARGGGTLAMPLDPSHPESTYFVTTTGIFDPQGHPVGASFPAGVKYLAAADIVPEIPGLEIVTTGGGKLGIYNGLTGAVIQQRDLTIYNDMLCPNGVGGGPPTIGDFDGDGVSIEIAVATGRHLTIFDRDGVPKYKTLTQDCSSMATGLTSFDLNGDRKPEILYADEEYLRIFEIRSGQLEVRYKIVNPTGTLLEYPVVADLTGTGAANILVASNNYAVSAFYADPGEQADRAIASTITGVRAFESSSEHAWMPTRPIWNQYSFHPDLVSDLARMISAPVVDSRYFRRNNQGNGLINACKN